MTPDGLSRPPSEHRRWGDKANRLHISRGSSHDASYFESIESTPLATRYAGVASSVAAGPPEGRHPITEGESSTSRLNSFATPSRSGEVHFPGDAASEDNRRRREAPPSRQASGASPIHVDEENAVNPVLRKRTHTPTFWSPEGRPSQGIGMHRCHTFHLFHKSNVTPRDEDAPQSQSGLDHPAREMFLEFFQRNLREQKRHEEALRAAPLVPKLSSGGLEVPDVEERLATTPQGTVLTEVPPVALVENGAEVEAVKALDMFSPDERNTRLDEFLTLVSASENGYDERERRRSRIIRGPNRAATIGTTVNHV